MNLFVLNDVYVGWNGGCDVYLYRVRGGGGGGGGGPGGGGGAPI
jgi:hypothetical protein